MYVDHIDLIDYPEILSPSGERILRRFQEMSSLSSDAFGYLFFDSDAYAPRMKNEVRDDQDADAQMDGVYPDRRGRRNEYDVSTITRLFRKNIRPKLQDWFSFIEVKSQRNITMNLYERFSSIYSNRISIFIQLFD